ncbi:TPA: hypothetical protein HA231_04520 [Candidatus Woesearchaeota archaeon]|nr:hypothetical protein [Candidatus Woesearchaeota archaeon]
MADTIAPFVTVSLALMIFLIALSWMAAALFRKTEYESFASVELSQLVVSVLLFVTVIGATCFATNMADLFARDPAHPGGRDVFEVGREYLNYISNEIALPAVINLEILKLWSQFMGSWTMRWGPSVWGIILPGFPSFIVIERVVDFLLLLISPFTASLFVQMAILEVIRGVVLPFVLPAGLVLRIFPPTRDAGAFMIASAIGFGIVYPYTYVMHNAVVIKMLNSGASEPRLTKTLEDSGFGEVAGNISLSGLFSADQMLLKPLHFLSYLLLQALFLPALSITITIAFIKGFSKFINQKL